MEVTHFFYADDATFLGGWDQSFTSIAQLWNCFHLASGLKINLHKSRSLGIGINFMAVERIVIRCVTLKLPFMYLSLLVGSSMAIIDAWEEVGEFFLQIIQMEIKASFNWQTSHNYQICSW